METVFYPFSCCFDINSLKKFFLLFEKTYFVDNLPIKIRKSINDTNVNNADYINDLYNRAFELGVISYIDSTHILEKYDEFICDNIYSDLNNSEFLEKSIQYNCDSFTVSSNRMPPSFKKIFYPGCGTYSEFISLQKLLYYNGDCSKIDKESMYDLLWDHGVKLRSPIITKESAFKMIDNEYKFVIGKNPTFLLPSYELSFAQLFSLRLNEIILVAIENDFALITDNEYFDSLLKLKNFNYTKSNSILNEKINMYKFNTIKKNISMMLLNTIYKDNDISSISIEKIIDFRMSNKKLFSNLWDYIEQVTCEMPENLNDYEIFQYVYKNNIHNIHLIQDDIKKAFFKSFGNLIIQSTGVIVPMAVTISSVGGSFATLISACTTAEIAYLATDGTEKLIDTIKNTKDLKNNPLAYLLNAKKQKYKKEKHKKINLIKYNGYIVLMRNEGCFIHNHTYPPCCNSINYIALVSFTVRNKNIFYLVNTEEINPNKSFNSFDFFEYCKKISIVKSFTADDLESAIKKACKIMPKIKLDTYLMDRYNFLDL
ncbi:MAG: hypothetical protein NC314_03220 [Roseburia sp.]|nr:hypothetical protein [Roseburia sp.]